MSNSNKFRVAFDFDGVLVQDHGRSFINFLIDVKGWKFDQVLFARTGSWTEAAGFSKTVLDATYVEFSSSVHAPTLLYTRGAYETLVELSSFCELHLITARSGSSFDQAIALTKELGVPFASHSGECHLGKGKVMSELDITLIIEDNPNELVAFANSLQSHEKRYALQFPSFLTPIRTSANKTVMRLPTCDRAEKMVFSGQSISHEAQSEIHRDAWFEVLHWVERVKDRLSA